MINWQTVQRILLLNDVLDYEEAQDDSIVRSEKEYCEEIARRFNEEEQHGKGTVKKSRNGLRH